jgi:rRNA-processing protein FCF1
VSDLDPFTGARLLLDANVLYPIRVCDFILTASSTRLLARAVVSEEILAEARRNIVADRPNLTQQQIDRRFENVRMATDGHDQAIGEPPENTSIVNAKDRHVLKAAIHHDVDFIVTNDSRLRREIAAWIAQRPEAGALRAAVSADVLASGLVYESTDEVIAVIQAMSDRFSNPARSLSETLASLAKSMPSLGALNAQRPDSA